MVSRWMMMVLLAGLVLAGPAAADSDHDAAVARLAARREFPVALFLHRLQHQAGALAPLHAGQRLHAGLGFGQPAAMHAKPPGAREQRGDGGEQGGNEGAEAEHPVTPKRWGVDRAARG